MQKKGQKNGRKIKGTIFFFLEHLQKNGNMEGKKQKKEQKLEKNLR